MEAKPLLLSVAGFEVLAYQGADGIRVAAWKRPKRIDSGVVLECEIQDPGTEITARSFQTIDELQSTVLEILRPH